MTTSARAENCPPGPQAEILVAAPGRADPASSYLRGTQGVWTPSNPVWGHPGRRGQLALPALVPTPSRPTADSGLALPSAHGPAGSAAPSSSRRAAC